MKIDENISQQFRLLYDGQATSQKRGIRCTFK